MFTGLIELTGNINTIQSNNNGLDISIKVDASFLETVNIGDSISVNGICSTVISKNNTIFFVNYLEETLKKTTISDIKLNHQVNLEKSISIQTPIGGHFVTGHVDTVAKLINVEKDDPWRIISIELNKEFRHLVVEKGSITLDGISLTVVNIEQDYFTCHLIPHTIEKTTFLNRRKGDLLNIEFDILGKYLYRFYKLENQRSLNDG
ncbi:riboflavin synthase [Candidatus Marinamargulisbacteria bacterium SCGC AG-410-N11]|nr:riboflavin synthase [Candidatus Marinamargulisbacteria bacterium SCGC AG-410-N11]